MTEKLNFFMQYVISIAQPKKYEKMVKLGGGRLFLYTLLLAFLTTFITIIPFVVQYFNFGGIEKLTDHFIPEFKYENAELNFEEKYDTTMTLNEFSEEIAETIYLYINTDTVSISDGISSGAIVPEKVNADSIFIVTKTDFTYLNEDTVNEFVTENNYTGYAYSELFSDYEFDKASIEQMIRSALPLLYGFFFLFLLIYMLVTLAGWYIIGVFYSIIAMIGNTVFKKNRDYGSLFKISLYAQTTAILVMTIVGMIENTPYTAINTVFRFVTVAYILLAIYFMKEETANTSKTFTYTESVYNSSEMEE